jgi:hypothetical protein
VDKAVDRLGELLVRGLRSHAIGLLDDLARGELIASCWRDHQATLASLTEEQRWQVRDALIDCVDCGLDQFLQAIRQSGVSLVVDGREVGASDVDLVGLMFGPGGWISRFGRQQAFGQDAEAEQNAAADRPRDGGSASTTASPA